MLSLTLTPGWAGGSTRTSLGFYLSLFAVLPGLVPWVLTAAGVASFAPAPWAWPSALAVGAGLNLVAGAVVLGLTALRFRFLEMC